MRVVKRGSSLEIDKNEIDELLAAKNFVGLNKSPRSEKVIVSLTSYKPRINDVKYTIYSLLNQTFAPDKLILWLDEDSFPQREENLPRDLLDLRDFGLTIDWTENLRPYKKLIPALEKFPDDVIVTADDDIFYQPDWLKILYDAHLENPDCVVAHRAHRILLDKQGNILPYEAWHKQIKIVEDASKRFGNLFTSGAGALYKKKFLYGDIPNREIFLKLSPLADDLWFWAMTVLNDTKIVIPSTGKRYLIYVDVDTQRSGETLWAVNKDKNDEQLHQILEYYPALLEKLVREAKEFKPYVSVILPIKNTSKADAYLKNILLQRFPEFEIIFIPVGSRLELQQLPTNFHVADYLGNSLEDALKLGLQKSTGEYVLFTDEASTFFRLTEKNYMLFRDALGNIAQFANDSKADVIHFSEHEENGKIVYDDAFKFEGDSPTVFDSPRQSRAVFWLKNKFSRRLETKIFKREFLAKYNINFDGGTEEFMFHALIQAEKYLIVPQAFCRE